MAGADEERISQRLASPHLPRGKPTMQNTNDQPKRATPLSLSDRVQSLRLPDRAGPPPRSGSKLPWVLCTLFALAAVAMGVYASGERRTAQQSAEQLKEQQQTTATSGPGTAEVASSGKVVLESKGNITPLHQIQVSPKVSGMVTHLYFKEGDWLKEGAKLADLEDVNYRADYNHAVAALQEAQQNLDELTKYRGLEEDQAKARWQEAEAQAKQLLADRDRSRRLLSGNSLAERDWEQADAAYQAMAARARSLYVDYDLLMHGTRDIRIKAFQRRADQAKADL